MKRILALLAVLLLAGCQQAAVSNTFNYTADPNYNYIGNSTEMCQTIRFACADDSTYFSDEHGCGCKSNEGRYPINHTLNGIMCTNTVDPVCGWMDENIKCFAYPCAQTYDNACLASKNQNVAYYTKGACPSVGAPSGKVDENAQLLFTYQPKQCQTTPWQSWYENGSIKFAKAPTDAELITAYYGDQGTTVSDVQRVESDQVVCQACDVCNTQYSFTMEARAGDKAVLADQGWSTTSDVPTQPVGAMKIKQDCTDPRPEACTMEYNPVCGDDGQTYSTGCVACSNSSVSFYTAGGCDGEGSDGSVQNY